MTANKKAKKITGDKAELESPIEVVWAKEDDPIYSRGWTIAPNMSGRLYKKESPSSEDTFTNSPQSSTLEDDITDPTFLSGLSKTRLGTTLEPRPSTPSKSAAGGSQGYLRVRKKRDTELKRRGVMKKTQKQTQDTKRIIGLPKDTERLSHSLLTSADDPAYAQLMMTSSLRSAPRRKTRDRD